MALFPPVYEEGRLAALDSYNILDTGEEKDFTDLTTLASAICQTPIAFINLFDEKRQYVKSHVLQIGTARTFRVPAINAEQEILIIEDATEEELFLEELFNGQEK